MWACEVNYVDVDMAGISNRNIITMVIFVNLEKKTKTRNLTTNV